MNLIDIPPLTRIDGGPEGRMYALPSGEKYPSVTTVLSAMSDKSALFKWRERIGEQEADKITRSAAKRGTGMHNLAEAYLLNKDFSEVKYGDLDMELFHQLKPYLDDGVDNIMGLETFLYSHRLKVAGSVDLIAEKNKTPTVIDFKTSLRLKRKQYIENYFLQATIYAYMWYERTKIMCQDISILISVEDDGSGKRGFQVFDEKTSNFIDKAHDIVVAYHRRLSYINDSKVVLAETPT